VATEVPILGKSSFECWGIGQTNQVGIQTITPFLGPRITLWSFNIAMENSPLIDGLPIKNGDFPWLC
jgi:hypothetical protein